MRKVIDVDKLLEYLDSWCIVNEYPHYYERSSVLSVIESLAEEFDENEKY